MDQQGLSLVERVIRYENGSMDEDEAVAFIAEIVKSGMVNHLQGAYGRTAESLIAAGIINTEGEVL